MDSWSKLIAVLFFSWTCAWSFPSADSLQFQPGFIKISTDTIGVSIYIDQVLVGQSPIHRPIPVREGLHQVSFIHPQILRKYLELGFDEIVRQTYVASGDTVKVTLDKGHHYQQMDRFRNEKKWSNTIGFTLLGISLYLLSILTL